MAKEQDHIGPDPVAWVSRLRDVAEGSQFHQHAKDIIEDRLSTLQHELAAELGAPDASPLPQG